MKVSVKIILLFILPLLSSCSGVDPYAMQAQAEALEGVASNAIRATQAAQYERAQAATIQAAQLQNEQRATEFAQSLYTTQTAQAFDLGSRMTTATQQMLSLQATQGAAYIQATQEAQVREDNYRATLVSAEATQTAISLQTAHLIERAEQEARGVVFWSQFIRVVWVITLLLFTYAVLKMSSAFFDRYYDWQDRKHRLVETRQGTVAFVWDGEREEDIPVLLVDLSSDTRYNRKRPMLDAPTQIEQVQVRSITPSGSVLESPVSRGETTERLVIRLLSASAEVAGDDSRKIPGWRRLKELGFNSEKWQRAVGALVNANAVYTEQGSGTFVDARFTCVVDLLDAVKARKIKIRPSSPPRVN
jgi:hypothetical protein